MPSSLTPPPPTILGLGRWKVDCGGIPVMWLSESSPCWDAFANDAAVWGSLVYLNVSPINVMLH